MKLRILENAVRLRLTRSEVDELAHAGRVRCETRFAPSSVFEYSIEAADISKPHVTFENSLLRVVVPKAAAKHWATSEEVGITGQCGDISILIEKDFQCTHVKSAIDHDLHPNPAGKP